MNALQKYLANRRAKPSQSAKPAKPTLATLAQSIKANRLEREEWREPTDTVHTVSFPSGCNVTRLLAHARASLPRLNAKLGKKPQSLRVEGKAEARWIESFATRF